MFPSTPLGWAIGVKLMLYLVLHRFTRHSDGIIELIEERTVGPKATLLRSPRSWGDS